MKRLKSRRAMIKKRRTKQRNSLRRFNAHSSSHKRPFNENKKQVSKQNNFKDISYTLISSIKHKNLGVIWKHPGTLMTISLIGIILLIPTLIVVTPSLKAEQRISVKETEESTVEQISSSYLIVPVKRSKTGDIERVPLEEYIVNVVASEMPAEFEIEALKAQALAARTYIVNHLLYQKGAEEKSVTDTVEHQVYHDKDELKEVLGKDYHWKIEKIQKAVLATESEILTYDSVPITPSFFSTSNGFTENSEDYWESELPYLRSVESKWDEQSPKFLSQHTFTFNQIEESLDILLQHEDLNQIEVERTESNRVEHLHIGEHIFTGREVREKLSLPSNDFSIDQKQDHFIFTTRGYGHGVGMSQYGANGMAVEGNSYEEIVSHYYKNVEIEAIEDVAPALVLK